MTSFPLSAPAHHGLPRGPLLFLSPPLPTPQPRGLAPVLPASPRPSSLLPALLPGSAPQTAEQLHPSVSFPGPERLPGHSELAPLTPSASPRSASPSPAFGSACCGKHQPKAWSFQLTPAHTASPRSSGPCPDAEDGPVGPAGDGEAGANWGSSTETHTRWWGTAAHAARRLSALRQPRGGRRARAAGGRRMAERHVYSSQSKLVYSRNQHSVKELFSN